MRDILCLYCVLSISCKMRAVFRKSQKRSKNLVKKTKRLRNYIQKIRQYLSASFCHSTGAVVGTLHKGCLHPSPHHEYGAWHTVQYYATSQEPVSLCNIYSSHNVHMLLGPPGCTQAFPYLSPGPLDFWWYTKTNKPLASRNQHKTNWVSHTASENDRCK